MGPLTSYPPPLSSPPTVETLERLLDGLTHPLQRGVPTPPAAASTEESLFPDEERDAVAEPRPSEVPGPATVVPVAVPVAGAPMLTWSAHDARRAGWSPRVTAGAIAVTVAAAVATALAAGIHLP